MRHATLRCRCWLFAAAATFLNSPAAQSCSSLELLPLDSVRARIGNWSKNSLDLLRQSGSQQRRQHARSPWQYRRPWLSPTPSGVGAGLTAGVSRLRARPPWRNLWRLAYGRPDAELRAQRPRRWVSARQFREISFMPEARRTVGSTASALLGNSATTPRPLNHLAP